MKKTLFISVLLFVFLAHSTFATEGMWLPNLIKSLNYSDMQSKGLMISAEEIYSVNNSSMKDAIAHFNGGCTSEVVSSKGLLFTNHHCGYGQIAAHSTVENNYLKDGFWAKNHSEEKVNPNLYVDFIVRIEDVTKFMVSTKEKRKKEKQEEFLARRKKELIASLTKGTKYLAKIKPFNYGNKYFAFIIERFTDIRLVGAPPSAIGKFGFDTDNWVWPRHTGDFSVFRIYANKDNKPADYSAKNVPYKPKYFFPISLQGVKEGDFSMVYGFPGRTKQFLTSYAVDQKINNSNFAHILMREKALEVINSTMKISEELRIKYAPHQSRVSNYWKKWKGENFGLRKEKALEKKREKEKEFTQRINNNPELKEKYGDLLPSLKKLYTSNEKFQKAYDYYIELYYSGPSTLKYIRSFVTTIEKKEELKKNGKLKAKIEELKKSYTSYLKNKTTEQTIYEKRMWKTLYSTILNNVDKEFHPANFSNTKNYIKNLDGIFDKMFKKSAFLNKSKLTKRLSKLNKRNIKKLTKDPAFKIVQGYFNAINEKINSTRKHNLEKIDSLMKVYTKAIQEVFPEKKYWYDANSTLRITYGKIEGSSPKDGMKYTHFTTAEGIMSKYVPKNEEFDVPEKLLTLIQNKEYGQYAENDSTLVICFTGSNHTTGGNSGSPVINAKGELIGINFDRSWESTMSDVMFSEKLCRNITVDIRYVLFVIDKYAGATHLIDELKLIPKSTAKKQ